MGAEQFHAHKRTDTTNLIGTMNNSVKANKIIRYVRFGFSCMSPKVNLTLRWVSVSVFLGVGTVVAVFGVILLLVSICLIIGAQKVSDAVVVLSTL